MKGLLNVLGLGDDSACKELADKMDAVNRAQAVIEFDLSGNILHANDNFLNLMGYRLDEVVGQHHAIFIEDEDRRSQEYQSFWSNLGRGQHFVSEFRRVTKSKETVWIHASYNPLLDDNGKPYKVVKFATDITENKKQSQLANALKLCQANVMLADNDNNIVYMNETVDEMLRSNQNKIKEVLPNFDVNTLIGSNVDGFHVNPSHQRGLLKNLVEPYNTDITLGDLVFGLIATPWNDADGNRVGTLVEWEDKTERVAKARAELAKSQENERIRKALDVCDTSVMMADADMNIIYMNHAVSDMLKNRETELKAALPKFNTSDLIGTNVDDFHQNPAHQRQLLQNLTSTYKTELKISGMTFGLTATPIRSEEGEFMGTVVEWEDKTERLAREEKEQFLAQENARVKEALDNVTTNVMIADADANIIYLNKAVVDMMRVAESDIKKQLPHFDVNDLEGKNIDIFHKNPAHQRNLLKDLKGTYHGKAQAGGRSFTVIANPVFQDGERVGTVVEWADRTEELAIEKQIDQMVESAAAGDFSVNIKTDDKEGFFLNLGNGLNSLVSTMEVALNDIVRMLGAMAKGDLSERITRDYQGAFGQMKSDANATADKLTEVITNIRISANSIATSSDEIAQGNADLSQRTEQQASSLEETAASMEEMTSTVKQSADNAEKANDMANSAQSLAREGGDVVKDAVSAMDEINKSSKKISDIISVIDEIAFQTNLLALNAAVEAARAGEQGRGFAVVAGEVRNLAQRSAGAAKEIKDLIRDSVGKVEDGTSLVNRSGEVLTEIVESVDKVTLTMQEIASAAREQSSGIQQVNTAVNQMDEMTQQNAALVEEASAAGQAMSDQAKSMNKVVEFFSNAASHESAAPVSAPPVSMPASSSGGFSQTSRSSVDSDDEWEEF
ncbi:MAG: PAS domain-containing protein [Agarilytica sp.]